MDRRRFLKQATFGAAGAILPFPEFGPQFRTAHLILYVTGGARKKDYLSPVISPNLHRLAEEACVFEEDHCEHVAFHGAAFASLLSGRESTAAGAAYPTILDYVGRSLQVNAAAKIPYMLQHARPRIIVCRDTTLDAGHISFERYLEALKSTDDAIGRLVNWVQGNPYFSSTTAIVFRPEFGRDDEVNEHGQLHHSDGFYSTHRVASIFWGPDFNGGVDRTTVINNLDMVPTLARLFGVDAVHAQGQVIRGLLRA